MSWTDVIPLMKPELILIGTACVLFLLGVSSKPAARKAAPVLAMIAMLLALGICMTEDLGDSGLQADPGGAIRLSEFGAYIKLISAAVSVLFILLAWPSDDAATGNSSLQFGHDAGEFFALLLLSVAGIFLVAGANDLILLFLGIELASIPTYIMVSVSRPLPVAQEAGVKYFFLGAMSAAVMLFGLSYLYGATGRFQLHSLAEFFAAAPALTPWQMLAVLMVIAAFAFKMAAVPLHFYAGDVYEGAATPVTALLSFVPKITGLVALIKLLWAVSAGTWDVPPELIKLLWIVAALTMTVGNVLGLRQDNVKRMLACSSIAHSGYLLVGVTTLLTTRDSMALQGILFYLAAYGMMNAAAFGVLMMLPSHRDRPATSAETLDELAGAGQQHILLGLAMGVACFSLIGLPLTVGFLGKINLIRPAFQGSNAWSLWNYWLVGIMMVNAAISAGYYLRIVAVMFLRPVLQPPAPSARQALPIPLAIALSTWATLLFGVFLPAAEQLQTLVQDAARTVDTAVRPPVSARR